MKRTAKWKEMAIIKGRYCIQHRHNKPRNLMDNETHFFGHLSPEVFIEEIRSRSWNTLRLEPDAFITVVYNPDKAETDEPTACSREG